MRRSRRPHKMDSHKINLVCTQCGEAFSAFLRDMAEHNAKVVCPRCGKVYDRHQALELAKGAPRNRSESSR